MNRHIIMRDRRELPKLENKTFQQVLYLSGRSWWKLIPRYVRHDYNVLCKLSHKHVN